MYFTFLPKNAPFIKINTKEWKGRGELITYEGKQVIQL